MFKGRWGKSVWRYHVSNGLWSSRIKKNSTRINKEFLNGGNSTAKSKILVGGEKKEGQRFLPAPEKYNILSMSLRKIIFSTLKTSEDCSRMHQSFPSPLFLILLLLPNPCFL